MPNHQVLEEEETGPGPGHLKALISQGNSGLSAWCSASYVDIGMDSPCLMTETQSNKRQWTEWSCQGDRASGW